MINDSGRLPQGNKYGVKSTDIIYFTTKTDVPTASKVTYTDFLCDYKPPDIEQHRIRLVTGGYKLDFDGDSGSPAASLIETNLLLNSILSGAKDCARCMSCDLKCVFLATPMLKPEHMTINKKYIPQDIREHYNIHDKIT